MIAKARTRTLGALTPSTTSWNWWTDNAIVPPVSSSTYANRVGYTKTMSDVVTPNFRKLVADGGVVNSPMSIREVSVMGGDTGWKFSNYANPPNIARGECFGNWCISVYGAPPDPGQDSSLVNHLMNLTATSAWADVDKSAVSLPNMLGEMHQTLNMLGGPVRSMTDFLWSKAWSDADWNAARGRAAKARALAKLLSSLWLQYQYAFKPIIMDIEDILDELQHQTFSPRLTARAQQAREIETSVKSTGSKGGINIDFTTHTHTRYIVRATIMYDSIVTPEKRFGMTWRELPSTAWELTPWSFVADWFINVGDYIRAITPKLDVRYLSCSHTIERLTTVRRSSGQAWMSQTGWVTERLPGAVDVATYRNKVRHPSLPPPSLTVETDLGQALGLNRGVNAYMLFLQQFIKPSRL